ncbi:Response regulator receiver domain-containing protein [Algoriphagus alkaliphilus]|uniref:Response regulator receiver domain-containing protein n=1 Tax=Algoriphagus alkaliphilus TaxID=279824 RepID=A0A1G5YKH2_9BACT|nr:response regulator [Algoriphagus alkaliphilus]SDA83328.1 Response regulator receiver domain-containing protein [Algoriphagus alkaliphilus]
MKKFQILLVEDNEGDILLTTEALETMQIAKEISVAKTGNEAIDYMTQSGDYAEIDLPDLVLLDINLPIKNGFEVLSAIRAHEKSKHIPVIILTTSSSIPDQSASNHLKANLFITKPTDMDAYEHMVREIEKFWLDFNRDR